jgi:hypothetical protein
MAMAFCAIAYHDPVRACSISTGSSAPTRRLSFVTGSAFDRRKPMIIHGKEIPNDAFRAFGEAVYDAMDRLIEIVPAGEERLTLTEALAAVIAVPLGADLSLSTEELEVIAGHVAA